MKGAMTKSRGSKGKTSSRWPAVRRMRRPRAAEQWTGIAVGGDEAEKLGHDHDRPRHHFAHRNSGLHLVVGNTNDARRRPVGRHRPQPHNRRRSPSWRLSQTTEKSAYRCCGRRILRVARAAARAITPARRSASAGIVQGLVVCDRPTPTSGRERRSVLGQGAAEGRAKPGTFATAAQIPSSAAMKMIIGKAIFKKAARKAAAAPLPIHLL